MNVLLDTHIALWSLYDAKKLNDAEKELLSDNDNTVYYSIASAWEIEIKHSAGKIGLTSEDFIKDCESIGYICINIARDHIFGLRKISTSPYHKDPFDRLLLAQAETENISFLTRDDKILMNYDNTCILRES